MAAAVDTNVLVRFLTGDDRLPVVDQRTVVSLLKVGCAVLRQPLAKGASQP